MLTRYQPGRLEFALLALAFGLAYTQFPLIYSYQNEYFYYGLARAGYGLLRHDWLFRTGDPWPLFGALVQMLYRYLDLRLVYLFYLCLLGIYLYSIMGIASLTFDITRSRARYVASAVVVTAVHSLLLRYVSERVFGVELTRELITGVASQRILWDMFQPGAFGVFLVLSVYLFLRDRPVPAMLAVAVATAFNPTYLLSAGILILSYMLIMARRGEPVRRTLGVGLAAGAFLAPVVAYMFLTFRPASPAIWAQAQEILVHSRLTRHAVPARWLSDYGLLKIAMIVMGLLVLRRTAVFWVMLMPFVAAVGLTLVQVVSHSNTLALLYPWRISVLLVPLATSLVLVALTCWLVDRVERRSPRGSGTLVVVSVLVLILLAGVGTAATAQRFTRLRDAVHGSEDVGLMRYVKSTRSPGQTYLIPTEWRNFRLYTGAPAFVDRDFVPYNDVGVVEWYRRVGRADAFYAAGRELRCQMSRELAAQFGITHIVLTGDAEACAGWTLLFQSGRAWLYATGPADATQRP